MCALETRSFERRGLDAGDFERRVSPLLQPIPAISHFEYGHPILTLAAILGLTWGNGLRVFGNWHAVAEPVAATLPFFRTTSGGGGGSSHILLPLLDSQRTSTARPINRAELVELLGKYAALPEKTQHVLNLALRRLRDSTEIKEIEDKVIDICVALEALFMEEGEEYRHKKRVSRRASWHFADSHSEREQVRTLLKEFYRYRERIVHGRVPEIPTPDQEERRVAQLADVENVVRASLKTMIAEGRPQDWEDSRDPKVIRHNPPRAETEIPSVKSDSLSWSVADRKQIDSDLRNIWMNYVDSRLPISPRDVMNFHEGILPEEINWLREQDYLPGEAKVLIQLYEAHPKWPKQEGGPVDERTKYYCESDVKAHILEWELATAEK